MSRKPENPKNGTENKQQTYDGESIPTGRRFSGNEEILTLEQQLVEDGVDLPNLAIPIEYHRMNNEYDSAELAELIVDEVSKETPNKALIGYLNELKGEL